MPKYSRRQEMETPDLEEFVALIPGAKLTTVYQVSGIGEFLDSADSYDPTYTKRYGTFGFITSYEEKVEIEKEHPDYVIEPREAINVGEMYYFFSSPKMFKVRK